MNKLSLLLFFLVYYIIYIYLFVKKEGNYIYISERVTNFHTLNMNYLNKIKCNYPFKDVYISSILVFLLSRDRLYATEYSIKYWLKLRDFARLKIIILDHYSSYYPLIEYYKQINNKYDIIVHRLNATIWRTAVDIEIPEIIKYYLSIYSNTLYYILSDIDIVLLNVPKDIFNLYSTVLCNCNVDVIGPSLMINDISPNFPDYRKVYEFETRYMKSNHYDVLYKERYYSFIKADIDTIFGMRKRNTKFKRHSKLSFRSLSPYIAHHIDWYLTYNNLPKSFLYYINRTKRINHSGSAFRLSNSLQQPY